MQYTNNNNLKLPEGTDNVRRQDFVDNFTTIDNGLTPFYVATAEERNIYKVATGLNKESLKDGYSIKIAIPEDSTGAASVIVDNVTVNVKKPNGNAVTNFKANGIYTLVYYNENFILASGGGADEVNFVASDLLEGKTANNSDGEKVNGTMKNLNVNSQIQYASDNGTKVIKGDGIFINTNTDGVERLSIRYSGDGGYIPNNTLIGQPMTDVRNSLGISADKIISGQTIGGVNGNIPNRGGYQYTGGIGASGDYIAFNRIPYGYYPSSGNGWSPEIRARKADFCNTFGITANKIVSGQSILDVAGNVQPLKYLTGTIGSGRQSINVPFTPKIIYLKMHWNSAGKDTEYFMDVEGSTWGTVMSSGNNYYHKDTHVLELYCAWDTMLYRIVG